MKRRILARAAQDLADIEAYISVESPEAALSVASKLRKSLDLITDRPEIGRPGSDYAFANGLSPDCPI
jgi:plasmid stabilization system protein ParE